METIFALSSGSYRVGVAVVRLSGPRALPVLKELTGLTAITPRKATLCRIRNNGVLLDQALILYFPAPHSFTGDDIVEFHLHGGRAVIEGVCAALQTQGCVLAEPGAFTRRAFENGKLDLTAAEAVADLIDAETQVQRDQALAQYNGALADLYGGWSEKLTQLLAHLEADIEFPDEDLPSGLSAGLKPDVEQLLSDIAAHLDDNRRGEILRDGVHVAIIGAPNAGKSSLLNALVLRDVAIVSPEAGTTRDIIEARLDLGGYPVVLSDTAGLRTSDNAIETEGVRRAKSRAAAADLKVVLFAADAPFDLDTQNMIDEKTLVVVSKADLAKTKLSGFSLSVKTGEGMEIFLRELTQRVAALFKGKGISLTRQRHRQALEETKDCLTRSLQAKLPELAAEDLRLALRNIGGITGRVHIEDILDKIFRDFCIGK